MAPEDQKHTVTWKATPKDSPIGRFEVDDLVIEHKGVPVYGFTQDQVERLKAANPGFTFTVEDGDTTTDEDNAKSAASAGDTTEPGTPGAGSQSRSIDTPVAKPTARGRS
jgi:hypothetical protein